MSNYHQYAVSHYQTPSSHNAHPHAHHHSRRRAPRIASQNAHRQFKTQRIPKEVPEVPAYNDYLRELEAARSFEFDDDEKFCPFNLLTEDDLHSMYASSTSERGSLSSGSPDISPVQQQATVTAPPNVILSAVPSTYQFQQMKLHQPMAQRSRNAIPIVDPTTRSVASPPMSVSPGRQLQQQGYVARRW